MEQREIVIGIRTDNEELGWTTRDAPILKAIGKSKKEKGRGQVQGGGIASLTRT